ncbi:MAG: FRG domain-containing protein [Planctomycetota bacterium]
MNTIPVPTWAVFRERLLVFAGLPRHDRNSWWFRGECSDQNPLQPTIDRDRSFKSDSDRERKIKDLLSEFRREVVNLGLGGSVKLDDAFELLARHHGLPSPHLDWTRSPWVASFFAFDRVSSHGSNVVIYALDRRQIPVQTLQPSGPQARPGLELVDNPELVLRNHRAARQRGVFLRRSTMQDSVETLLDLSLTQFILPAAEADTALRDLDQMLLNSSMLMYDLDGAARTADRRTA